MNLPKFMLYQGERVELLRRGHFEDSIIIRLPDGTTTEVQFRDLKALENQNV
jgi:hypothetical protein